MSIDNKLINEAVKNYVEDCSSIAELLGDQNDEYSTDPLGDLEVLSPFPSSSFKATRFSTKAEEEWFSKLKPVCQFPPPR